MSLRALFVCQELRRGGAQRQWVDLARGLAERGAAVRVLTLGEEGELFAELAAAGIPARCARMSSRMDPRGWRRALSEAAEQPDVVLAQQVSGQVVGLAIARRAGAPLVVCEHTPCLPDGRLVSRPRRQRLLLRPVVRRAALAIAVAHAQVGPLRALGYQRVEVIPNGVFEERLTPSRSRTEVRAELGLDGGDFAVLALAALRPEKRLDLLVEAVSRARRDDPSVRALVAGGGEERGRLERLAADGAVQLIGARSDAPDLLAACDCACLSSDAEALPMAALEAMALGRPVVATDVGDTATAVAHRRTGLVVPAGDPGALAAALLELARDRDRAREMGEAGRERQRQRFGGAGMVAAYERVLSEVAA